MKHSLVGKNYAGMALDFIFFKILINFHVHEKYIFFIRWRPRIPIFFLIRPFDAGGGGVMKLYKTASLGGGGQNAGMQKLNIDFFVQRNFFFQ